MLTRSVVNGRRSLAVARRDDDFRDARIVLIGARLGGHAILGRFYHLILSVRGWRLDTGFGTGITVCSGCHAGTRAGVRRIIRRATHHRQSERQRRRTHHQFNTHVHFPPVKILTANRR